MLMMMMEMVVHQVLAIITLLVKYDSIAALAS